MPVNLLIALGFIGCRGATEPREIAALVMPDAWVVTSAAQDPFSDRPEQVSCEDGAWFLEAIGPDDSLSVDTLGCDYLVVEQPSLAEVLEGDGLFVRLWHYELTAGEDAQAHWGLAIGGELVYDEYLPIPSESGMSAPEWVAGRDYDAGETVHFHLHNHGANSYNLIEFSVRPP